MVSLYAALAIVTIYATLGRSNQVSSQNSGIGSFCRSYFFRELLLSAPYRLKSALFAVLCLCVAFVFFMVSLFGFWVSVVLPLSFSIGFAVFFIGIPLALGLVGTFPTDRPQTIRRSWVLTKGAIATTLCAFSHLLSPKAPTPQPAESSEGASQGMGAINFIEPLDSPTFYQNRLVLSTQ
jgi:hypothetical protein